MVVLRILTCIILCITTSFSIAKTIDLDPYFAKEFNKKEYKKCYKLCQIYNNYLYNQIHQQNYNKSTLKEFGIIWKEGNAYTSDSTSFYEFKSLFIIDRNLFNYHYAIKNEVVSKWFNRDSINPSFIIWADSMYNTPVIGNYKIEIYRKSWLIGVYRYLQTSDTATFNRIFRIDNSDLIKLVKNRSDKDLLSLYSSEFNLRKTSVYRKNKLTKIQNDIILYYDKLFKQKSFLTIEQIQEFLFVNTHFTDEENMFVAYYFTNQYLTYSNPVKEFCSNGKFDDIILYRLGICSDYSHLLGNLLHRAGLKSWEVMLETDIKQFGSNLHANNIVMINNKFYYVDATWDIYFRDFNSFEKSKLVKNHGLDVKLDYSKVKDMSYIIDYKGYDTEILKNEIKRHFK
jgi:hypothetical protein